MSIWGMGLFLLFFLVFVIGGIALFIYALVDALRMPNDAAFKTGSQLVWVLVIVLAQGIGAVIYLIVGRPPGGATGARERFAQSLSIPPPPPPP
jgi:Phospholipase_D-nuclease N-terminal